MNTYIKEILDFFLPRLCASCENKLLTEEDILCPECISSFQFAEKERLQYEFNRKFTSTHFISGYISLFIFEKDKSLQEAIHKLKYQKRFQIGLFFGKLISIWYKEQLNEWKIDLIIPVPLHHLKKAERGFNQSYYIAKGLSRNLSLKFSEKILKRKRFTESQTTKTLIEREDNMQGAFTVKKSKEIKGKNVLLVDDVITTGATIRECGKCLIRSGANMVYAASVAIAD